MLRSNRIHAKRLHVLAVGAVGAALALTACGSSATSASPSSSSSGSSAATIQAKIMVAGDITSNIPFTVPEIVPSVKGALRGFPGVEVETCDTKGLQSAGLACEQKAIQDHVSAFIFTFSVGLFDQSMLLKAGIPVLGTADTSKDNSFATNSGTGVFAAIGIGLAKQGCTKLGDLYADGGAILADNVKNGVESQGGKEVARAAVAANAPDVSPAVARITGAGAQCIALNVSPGAVVQALTALKQSGKTLTAGGVSAIFTKQILDSLGPLANGLIVAEMQLDGGDAAAPGIAAVTADVHAISASAPVTQAGVIGWISAKLVAAALPKVQGPVTATSLMAALNGLRNVSLDGVIPPWSSVELTSPAYKRLFNHYAINYKIENGVPIRQGDFFDMAPVLEGASAASSQ